MAVQQQQQQDSRPGQQHLALRQQEASVPPVVLVQQLHHQVALAEAGLEAHLQQVSVAQQTTWEAPEQAT